MCKNPAVLASWLVKLSIAIRPLYLYCEFGVHSVRHQKDTLA